MHMTMMAIIPRLLLVLTWFTASADAFSVMDKRVTRRTLAFPTSKQSSAHGGDADDSARRSMLAFIGSTPLLLAGQESNAAVGSLEEFSDANAILQGITVRVADKSQQEAMIDFLHDGFNFQVLRKRIREGTEETWLGFGPEQLSVPTDFQVPMSWSEYGGHASIHLVYDSKAESLFYRTGEAAPGNNIAYLQVGVPEYRISQMVKNGGNILDAYGIVNVVSPAGLPMRGIVGIRPDPIMFVAINCENVENSKAFYQQLGFVEQEYPFARPNKGMGQFEPPQPEKSVYLAPSKNCLGVLLLPLKKKKKITSNPAVDSLNIVYSPSTTSTDADSDSDSEGEFPKVVDPSGVPVAFKSVQEFETEEKLTR